MSDTPIYGNDEYPLSREAWTRPAGDVWACFECNGVDAPILRGIKSAGCADEWLNAAPGRFLVTFRIDDEPVRLEPERDLFSISGVTL